MDTLFTVLLWLAVAILALLVIVIGLLAYYFTHVQPRLRRNIMYLYGRIRKVEGDPRLGTESYSINLEDAYLQKKRGQALRYIEDALVLFDRESIWIPRPPPEGTIVRITASLTFPSRPQRSRIFSLEGWNYLHGDGIPADAPRLCTRH